MTTKYIILFFYLFYFTVYSQNSIRDFDGLYSYEIDNKSVLSDDMIYRKPVIYLYENRLPQLKGNVFIFEPFKSDIKIDISKSEKTISKKITEALDWTNDSIHNLLKNYDSKIIVSQNLRYKVFKLKFKALYLGKREHFIRKGRKFKAIKSPTYLIYDFIKITAYSEGE